MTGLITVRPTGSFSLALPQGICAQRDERVSSFWVAGEPLLLQISSYVRTEGQQPSARERLAQRMAKHREIWRTWDDTLYPDQSVDQATAESWDAKGCLWIHSYLVWPHLAIYLIISGPEADALKADSWAANAVKSIELTVH